jgi:cell division protein FtsB
VLTCVIAIVALVLGAVFGDRGILHLVEKRREASSMDQEIARLESENQRLAVQIQALHEARAVETIAREELGLVRPGETVFLIQDEPGR